MAFEIYATVQTRTNTPSVPGMPSFEQKAEVGISAYVNPSNLPLEPITYQPEGNIDKDTRQNIIETWWDKFKDSRIIKALNEYAYYIALIKNAELHKVKFEPRYIYCDHEHSKVNVLRVYFDCIDSQTEYDLSVSTGLTSMLTFSKVAISLNDTNPNHYLFYCGEAANPPDSSNYANQYYCIVKSRNNPNNLEESGFAHNGEVWKYATYYQSVSPEPENLLKIVGQINNSTVYFVPHSAFREERYTGGLVGAFNLLTAEKPNTIANQGVRPLSWALSYKSPSVIEGTHHYGQQYLYDIRGKNGDDLYDYFDSFDVPNFYLDIPATAIYQYLPQDATINFLDEIKWYQQFTPEPPKNKLIFTLHLTGMGNDPCKRCCSCEIEEKKYKTIIEFTSDEALEGKVTIDPADLEFEWQGNTLNIMLAEGETVTVDQIPAGVEYEILVESDDPCDENEYIVDNGEGSASGIIGEDSEGNPQEETEVTINAQRGETVEEYLERLRQKGYEALAESLKLENVEFTLQDERIKLGDLVTVDMPEFDFKAVVRVTGVKLKSQDNQTIRTISVGTPLKILRKSRI